MIFLSKKLKSVIKRGWEDTIKVDVKLVEYKCLFQIKVDQKETSF